MKLDPEQGSSFSNLPERFDRASQGKLAIGTRALCFSLGVMALPAVYGRFILEYPCEWVSQRMETSDNTTSTVRMQMDPDECGLQDFLRSHEALLLGPLIFGVALVVIVFETCITRIAMRIFGGGQPLVHRLLQFVFYSHLRARILNFTFTKHRVWIAVAVYLFIAVEMITIAVAQKKFAVGFVIAFAVGEIYCYLVNYCAGATDRLRMIVQAEIKALGLFYDIFENNSQTLALTKNQIENVIKLWPYDDVWPEWSDQQGSIKEYAMHDIYTNEAWVTAVYCTDTDELYEIQQMKKLYEIQQMKSSAVQVLPV